MARTPSCTAQHIGIDPQPEIYLIYFSPTLRRLPSTRSVHRSFAKDDGNEPKLLCCPFVPRSSIHDGQFTRHTGCFASSSFSGRAPSSIYRYGAFPSDWTLFFFFFFFFSNTTRRTRHTNNTSYTTTNNTPVANSTRNTRTYSNCAWCRTQTQTMRRMRRSNRYPRAAPHAVLHACPQRVCSVRYWTHPLRNCGLQGNGSIVRWRVRRSDGVRCG